MVKNPNHSLVSHIEPLRFYNIEQEIYDLNKAGYFFEESNLDLNNLYKEYFNDKIKKNYKLDLSIKGYHVDINYSEDYTKCYINYYTFNNLVFKYDLEELQQEQEPCIYNNYKNSKKNITIDLYNKKIYSKSNLSDKFIPVSFNNIRYHFNEEHLLFLIQRILEIISEKSNLKTFDFNLEDLLNSTSEQNIFSIIFYNSRKSFLKEINKNNIIDIPNWSIKSGSFLLSIYIKLCKKTEPKSLGIIKDFFNKNHEIILKELNEDENSLNPIFYIIERIYLTRNQNIIKDIKKQKNFSNSEFYDYYRIIMKRRFKEFKFNFNIKSAKRLKYEHDKIFSLLREKEAKKLKLIKYDFNKEYKTLIDYLSKSNLNIAPVKNNRDLLSFATYMKNCVYQYNSAINKSKCIVLKGTFKENVHCILIQYINKQYKLIEIKRRFNKSPIKKYELEISKLLEII